MCDDLTMFFPPRRDLQLPYIYAHHGVVMLLKVPSWYVQSMPDRFMLNLGPALMEQVGALAVRNGVTKGEVTRHAVRLYLALEEAVSRGETLQVLDTDGTVTKVLPLTLARPKAGPHGP